MLPTIWGIGKVWRFVLRRSSYRTFIDIGIRFSCVGSGPSFIEFLPPAKATGSGQATDLSGQVLDERVSDLIFGSSVTISGRRITYRQSDMLIGETVLSVDRVVEMPTGRYRAYLSGHMHSSDHRQNYYARFRYECDSAANLLKDKGWGYAKRGWIFDLRVNDVRETVELPAYSSSERLADVDNCYVFVVAPNSFVPALASPSLQYTRLLELKVWKSYLRDLVGVQTGSKSTIYYWRSEVGDSRRAAVTTNKPMRTYMHLHREFGWTIFAFYGAGIVALPWISQTLHWAGEWLWKALNL